MRGCIHDPLFTLTCHHCQKPCSHNTKEAYIFQGEIALAVHLPLSVSLSTSSMAADPVLEALGDNKGLKINKRDPQEWEITLRDLKRRWKVVKSSKEELRILCENLRLAGVFLWVFFFSSLSSGILHIAWLQIMKCFSGPHKSQITQKIKNSCRCKKFTIYDAWFLIDLFFPNSFHLTSHPLPTSGSPPRILQQVSSLSPTDNGCYQ